MSPEATIQNKPRLSGRAFWDVDRHTLDFGRHADFIISRVFERGTAEDQQELLAFYGEEAIIRMLTQSPSILPIARERAKQLFHLSDQDFACYTGKQPHRSLSRF